MMSQSAGTFIVGFLGFLGYGFGSLVGEYANLPFADMVGLIAMVGVGALAVLHR